MPLIPISNNGAMQTFSVGNIFSVGIFFWQRFWFTVYKHMGVFLNGNVRR